ncbi:hypothetical protein VT84_09510 [Gemmata sp. SH-PL17]|uniref:hypothetical protein n=1 Tax=Gemmata sp. SH-PL17 TaxID=1630693 RepID=UPI00078D50E3|nr:hypothetical protein [Gemmata sp. SH-PL17]AMV24621.1 hypothetical protein VT84_09510 [Gemmata sp. SH-PL17]
MIAGVLLEFAPLALFGSFVLAIRLHSREERGAWGGESFWSYSGRFFWPRVPDWIGWPAFVGLELALYAVAYLALVHDSGVNAKWLARLFGLVLADFALSHVGLSLVFARRRGADGERIENPGIATSVNYPLLVAIAWLILQPAIGAAHFAQGVAVFASWWLVSFLFLRRKGGTVSRKISGRPHPFPAPDASFETGFNYPFIRGNVAPAESVSAPAVGRVPVAPVVADREDSDPQ